MKKNDNIVVRQVPPAVFLVDITRGYNTKEESLLEIDDIGLAIWNCIERGDSRQQVIDKFLALLTDEKTQDFIEMVSEDIDTFLDILIQGGCIEEEE